MLGIQEIASFIPNVKISNYDLKDKYEIDDNFIEKKIGIKKVAFKDKEDDTSDLCVKAFHSLTRKLSINPDGIECLVLVSQNPDFSLPHTSALVHGKLNLSDHCACFDISLGCSGFVYGLSIIESFMKSNQLKKGLLFTSDPYSKIISKEDKNTAMLFGDAATVSLISNIPKLISGIFNFGTIGKSYKELICNNGILAMNGRAIFNFAAKYVPVDIKHLLKINDLSFDDIDSYVFHQGSKYIIDTITKRLKIDPAKVPFDATFYGNTVSSSIPIVLEKVFLEKQVRTIVISGFGVGLSWASTVLKRF